jgi:hypothetical protein
MSDKKYTAREVQDALEDFTWDYTFDRYDYDYVEGRYTRVGDPIPTTVECEFSWDNVEAVVGQETPVGKIEVVELDEGGEGHGEDIHVVIKVVETEQLFRLNGSYTSYVGSEWDGDLYPVTAVERTVVFYE